MWGGGEGCEECSGAGGETVEAEGTHHFLIIAMRERGEERLYLKGYHNYESLKLQ